jgi:hypothetical protein
MRRIIFILLILISFIDVRAQFPSTDSLRNYNIVWITNNAARAFTNYRLHTLLAGMIDWIDSARAGEGGTIGIDSIGVLNDSTLRYRKNSTFYTLNLKGVYDSRRKLDTLYKTSDSTFAFTINNTLYSITMPGRTNFVDSIYRKAGQDSIFYRRSGVEYALQDQTGGSGSDNPNIGGGFRLVIPSNQSIKTLFSDVTGTWDSISNTNGLTYKVDTLVITTNASRKKLADSLAALISSSAGINQLTGDVTAGPGSGSQAATIAPSAVTTTKIADLNVTTDKIAASAVTTAKIADNNITTAKVADNNITYAKVQQVAANRLLGNPTGSIANVSEIPVGVGLHFNSNTLKSDTGTMTTNMRLGKIIDSLMDIIETGAGTNYFQPLDERVIYNPVTSYQGRTAYHKVQVVESSGTLAYSVGLPANDTLQIPSYVTNNSIAHFSLVWFRNGWHGKKYYLAYTPYPPEAIENPSIVVGDFGYDWVAPAPNPVIPAPTPPAYNSDVHLFYDTADDRLYMFYRFETAGGTSQHWMVYTEDGAVTWSSPQLIISSGAGASPSYMHERGRWIMWDVDYTTNSVSQDPYYLNFRESFTLEGMNDAPITRCDIGTAPSGYHIWHPNIIKDSAQDQFIAYFTYTLVNPGGAPNNGGIVRYATSTNGLRWSVDTSNFPYVDNMYRNGIRATEYSRRNGAAAEVILNPQWKAKRTLLWIRETVSAKPYDTVSRLQGVFSLKTRLSNHGGLPLLRAALQAGGDTLDIFDDGNGGLETADDVPLETWGTGDTIRLLRLYNQVNERGDYFDFPDPPYLTQNIWEGTTAWGWVFTASQTNYGITFRTNIPQGYTVMARQEDGKFVSKNNSTGYFGKNQVNTDLLLQSSANIATPLVPSPFSWTGIYNGSSSVIRRNGTQMVTGSTTDPAAAGNLYMGAFFNGTSLQDYMTGQMTELVVWDDVPYSGGLTAVENQQLADYPWNADSLVYDTYTDANGTAVTSHTPEIGGSYTASDANWQINSNSLRRTAAGSGQPTAVLNAGVSDGVVEGTVTPGGSGGSGLVFRYVDNNNFYYVRVFGGTTLGIFKYVAGSVTAVGSTATVSAAGAWTARVELWGTRIRVFLNGATTPQITTTDSSFPTATQYGFHAATGDTPTSAVFDNLKFERH